MLSVEEAFRRILDCVNEVGTEGIALADGLNRILGCDVVAPIDLPPFSHATVDGFAVRSSDIEKRSGGKAVALRVVEEIMAGSVPTEAIKPGMAIRIMTGARLPEGADAVVKLEDTSPPRQGVTSVQVEKSVTPLENVASAGEEVKRGEVVLKKGEVLRPESIGGLVSLGLRKVIVFRQPEIALLSTGNELIRLDEERGAGKIFANSFYLLLAKIREAGCIPLPLGVARDDPADIKSRIRSALGADAIITTGGTRQGDADWVKDVYDQMGILSQVQGVAMSPGRSFIFGLLEGRPIFSLPGSPTASLVAFEELVRPSILKMRGTRTDRGLTRPTLKMGLEGRVRGKRGLKKYVLARVVLKDGKLVAIPIERKHRGALTSVIQANGFVMVPEGTPLLDAGQEVNVRLFDLNS
jgi:molybdopterin molybdotransferase